MRILVHALSMSNAVGVRVEHSSQLMLRASSGIESGAHW